MATKTEDRLFVATTSFFKASPPGAPVFVAQGSVWRLSSGVPDGTDKFVPHESSTIEVHEARRRSAEAEAQATANREKAWAADDERGKLAAFREMIGL
jgi:hypothetical protein